MHLTSRSYDTKNDIPSSVLIFFLLFLILIHFALDADNYFSEKPNPHIELAPKVAVQDVKHLDSFFQEILDLGGEGIILRDPKSPYVPGRSPGYLKYKVRPPSPHPQKSI